MNKELREELEYRIENLKIAIRHIQTLAETMDLWEDGYRCSALYGRETELRFLEQMVAKYV
jgi:hypothetical protein